jgi:hypothetical protein
MRVLTRLLGDDFWSRGASMVKCTEKMLWYIKITIILVKRLESVAKSAGYIGFIFMATSIVALNTQI